MLRARPKVVTFLLKTEHAIQMHCVLHGKCSAPAKVATLLRKTEQHDANALCLTWTMLPHRPTVATLFRKTEHTIQMHCGIHGKCSAPDLK